MDLWLANISVFRAEIFFSAEAQTSCTLAYCIIAFKHHMLLLQLQSWLVAGPLHQAVQIQVEGAPDASPWLLQAQSCSLCLPCFEMQCATESLVSCSVKVSHWCTSWQSACRPTAAVPSPSRRSLHTRNFAAAGIERTGRPMEEDGLSNAKNQD